MAKERKNINFLFLITVPVFIVLIAGLFSFSANFETAYAISYGGGVFVGSNSVFTMNSGSICGYGGECLGAGIYVESGGTLNFKGGTIFKNYSQNGGDNIYNNGTVNMQGGSVYTDANSKSGYNIENNGTFTLSGGTIGVSGSAYSFKNAKTATLNVFGGTIYDNILTESAIHTKMSASVAGKIVLLGETAKVIVEDWNGTVPSYVVQPFDVGKVFMVLKGGNSKPDLSPLSIEGFTLSDKIYLESTQNSDGDWEISLVKRVSKVTLDSTIGSCDTKEITVGNGEEFGTLPTPSCTGYKFLGWSRNYFQLTKYIGTHQATVRAGKITLKPSKTNTTAGFQIQMWNNDSLVSLGGGTMLWASATGHFSTTFTKTEELKQIYLRLNADVDDAYVMYDIQDLKNGHDYVVSLDVAEFGVNKIVVQNVVIEENSLNQETTSSFGYIQSTTINDLLCNFTIFACWEELTCTVNIKNYSGSNYEGTVMGKSSFSKSYKYGETFTISYVPNGKYEFVKVVNGTLWDSPEVTNLTHTITEEDLTAGKLNYTICYNVSIILYAWCGGNSGVATGGTVMEESMGAGAGTVTVKYPYAGPGGRTRIIATKATNYYFDGWYTDQMCFGKAYSYDSSVDISFGSDGAEIYLGKFTPKITRSPYFTNEWRQLYEEFTNHDEQVENLLEIQFRSRASVESNTRNGSFAERFRCKNHNKKFTKTGTIGDFDFDVYQCGTTHNNCVIFATDDVIYTEENLSGCFANLTSLEYIVFENLDTSNVTNMSEMFMGCSSLIMVDLSTFNTDHVTNFARMFQGCDDLYSLNLSNFKIRPNADVSSMLDFGCTKLKFLYTPRTCMQEVPINTALYDFIDSTLDETIAQENNINQGEITSLPTQCRSSRTLVPDLPTRETIDITSADIKTFLTVLEVTAGTYVDLEFAFEEPDIYFTYSYITFGVNRLYGYMKEVVENGKTTAKITIFPEDLTRINFEETQFFANVMTKIKSSKINLNSVKFSNVCTDRLATFEGFFKNCGTLTSISGMQNFHFNITSFLNPNSTKEMFYDCSSLEYIDMSNMLMEDVADATSMFSGCGRLSYITMYNTVVAFNVVDNMFNYTRPTVIYTPINYGREIPFAYDEDGAMIFSDSRGNEYYSIPRDLDKSIVLGFSRMEATSSTFLPENENNKNIKFDFFNFYSAFAMVCISALAYPQLSSRKDESQNLEN